MRARGFKEFYGDGYLAGYQVGPGPQLTLTVNPCVRPHATELCQVWLGRVVGFEQVREFLAALGDPSAAGWHRNIDELSLDPATAKQGTKRVSLWVWHEGVRRGIQIECKDIAER